MHFHVGIRDGDVAIIDVPGASNCPYLTVVLGKKWQRSITAKMLVIMLVQNKP